jgi:hypothetical protein
MAPRLQLQVFMYLLMLFLPLFFSSSSFSADISTQVELLHGKVECTNGVPCFENVGLVQSIVDDKIRVCTGFLVSSDELLTNSHCLPPELQTGDPAIGKVSVTFPAVTDHVAVSIYAQSILSRTALTYNSDETVKITSQEGIDYALLKLPQGIDRHPLAIKTAPIPVGSPVFLVKIAPHFEQSHWEGQATLNTCTLEYFDEGFPALTPIISPKLFLLKKTDLTPHCELSKGSSGAAILDSQGFAHGLTQGLAMANANVREDLILATNLACVKTPQNDVSNYCTQEVLADTH